MKKAVAFLLVIMVGIGCATREEQARTNIVRTWKILRVFQNDLDVTNEYLDSHIDYRLSFDNNGNFSERYYPFNGSDLVTVTGTWLFTDGIDKLTLTDNNQSRVFQIDLLDKDNLTITNLSASSGRKFEMVPQ
ncbi:MAG: hypothetical protein EP314_05380 [Bacteroidetes bacterium]|nr:MAG: hypothetical protein EP314_05380 [Bacteroidota bacterium]